jgi:hypothetical protein
MFFWSMVGASVLSLLTVGLFREFVPFWLHSGGEMLPVISLVALVCLSEPGGGDLDQSSPAL